MIDPIVRLNTDVPPPGQRRVVFLHGLESGPHGGKYKALVEAGLFVVSPDLQGVDLAGRVEAGLEVVRAGDPANTILVGSSYGGATAVVVAHRLGEAGTPVRGCVLCAPALYRDEPPLNGQPPAPSAPTVVIHAVQDDIVPYAWSERWATAHGIALVAVDDNHRLSKSRDRIVALVQSLL
jgi:pimeloyl-ACP methyl ester carboxylesterase